MAKTPEPAGKLQGIEYKICTVDQDGISTERDAKTDMKEAIAVAEELLASKKYLKIEVRQKYFDKKSNRDIDVVLKTFEGRKNFKINAVMIFIFALFCGIGTFAATYFLTRSE
ncbi:MAG: hypothetical protein CO093_11750 [Alphaproteobacteria bacterium CG_4_9_14_3_um_filter_47_13]|nr:MAG: hypothetical protein CO093_11750 [Alphaproteobacteria bacterium CG_4_9_14_3_um_filter_47_13]